MTYSLADHITAFSTERHCSEAAMPYDGFNITHYCGDEREHVRLCREQLCRQLGITDTHLIVPRQVHGVRIEEVTEENRGGGFEDTDALITRLAGVCIGISTADCVPLLFYDKRTDAIAAAHAGWRGTVAHIGALTFKALQEAYGTKAEDVSCVIGPSIGPEAFEVGEEVYAAFADAGFPMADIAFRHPATQRWHIDLWRANAWQLTQAGITAAAIHVSGLCTYTHYSRFFSARRLGINSGRIFTGIMRQN
ncbi:MAG: peptidoglycan editing factor PgeF [Bacteroidaceae bacterium]|nr:peptidoglycan editing factor PgeF [Bacteroidaceae bacterium]